MCEGRGRWRFRGDSGRSAPMIYGYGPDSGWWRGWVMGGPGGWDGPGGSVKGSGYPVDGPAVTVWLTVNGLA